jgi:hypothetical protein
MAGRLMVGQQILVLFIGVRVPARQYLDSPAYGGLARYKCRRRGKSSEPLGLS